MSAFTRANPIGWSAGNPVTAAQMNALDLDHVKTINIVDGGATYNPTTLIQIGGAGFQWNGPSAFASTSTTTFSSGATIAMQGALNVTSPGAIYLLSNGRIIVQNTGEIAVQTGGDLVVESGGTMHWESGSLIQAEDGSTFQLADGSVFNSAGIVNFGATSEIFGAPRLASAATLTAQSGSTIAAASGSTVTFSGTTTFANSTWPALSPARTWSRRNLRMLGTADPTEAEELFTLTGGGGNPIPTVRIGSTAAAFYTLLEIDDLPDGQTISSVVVRSLGNVGAPIINRAATYRVVRWTDETTLEAMSAATNDAHNSANWSTTTLDTTITITAHSTIDRSYRYGVEIMSQLNASDDWMNIFSVLATGTAASIRV